MIGKLALSLALLTIANARPNRHNEGSEFTEPHELCPTYKEHHLLPHEYDCAKFYYCEYGQKWIEPRICAPGTVFSYRKQVCIHPTYAGCWLPGFPQTPPPTEGHPEGFPELEVPEETSPEVPENGNGENPGPEEHPESHPQGVPDSGEDNGEHGPDNGENGHPDNGPDNGERPEVEWLPNGCPADYNVDKLFPHPTQCSKYLICVYGEKVERDCPAGLLFNADTKDCDWPENVDCNGNGISENPGPEEKPESHPQGVPDSGEDNGEHGPDNGENGHPDNGPDNGERPEVEWLPNGCPADYNVDKLFPHPTQCSKYLICVYGEKVERDCPAGLLFNADTKDCDWPENVDCNGNGISENPGPEEKPESHPQGVPDSGEDNGEHGPDNGENGHPDNGPDNGERPEVEWLPNGCPADYNVDKLFPHPTQCSKYLICVYGEKVERDCPAGLLFNADTKDCDWPKNVDCNGNGISENPGPEEKPESHPQGVPDSGEDNGEHGPDNGENGHPDNGPDNGERPEGEWLPNGCPADYHVDKLFPHPTQCSKYLICVYGEKVERDCPAGLLFNADTKDCDWPENVDCNGHSNGENPGPEEKPESHPQGVPDSGEDNGEHGPDNGENGHPDNGPDNGERPEVEWLPNGCPADYNVDKLFPHPTQCSKYLICVYGEKVERDCPAGLYFNPDTKDCDWPENVDCKGNGNGNGENPEEHPENHPEGEPGNGTDENTDNGEDNEDNEEHGPDNGENDHPDNGPEEHPESHPEGEPDNGTDENTDNGEDNEEHGPDNGENGQPENGENGNGNGENPEVEWLPNGCPADWDIHHLVPHEADCGKFYYCVYGELVERECSGGLHFNPVLQVCDWPENVGCHNGNGNGENPDNGTDEEDEDNNGHGNGNGTDENTDNGEDSGEHGPGNGENGHPDNGGHGSDENGNGHPDNGGNGSDENGERPEVVWLDNGCPADWDIHHLVPHEADCGKFYYCVYGELVERECSGGLHFNPVLQVCDWPQDAGCQVGGGNGENSGTDENTDNGGDNGEHGPDNGENGHPDNGNGEEDNTDDNDNGHDSGDSSNENNLESHYRCSECNVGDWAHETDCNKYWRCERDIAVLLSCTEGLHFNRITKTCDFISNAGCSKENAPAASNRQGTNIDSLSWTPLERAALKLFFARV